MNLFQFKIFRDMDENGLGTTSGYKKNLSDGAQVVYDSGMESQDFFHDYCGGVTSSNEGKSFFDPRLRDDEDDIERCYYHSHSSEPRLTCHLEEPEPISVEFIKDGPEQD